MPKAFSEHTRHKQQLATGLMHALLTWFKMFGAGRFVYFDMNAYRGVYSDAKGEIKGSPVNFIETAKALDVPSLSVLFEKKPQTYNALLKNVIPRWSAKHLVVPIKADSAAMLGDVMHLADGTSGLDYCDECGSGLPFVELMKHIPSNVDLAIHTDLRSFLRKSAQYGSASFNAQFKKLRSLKKFWFIAPPDYTSKQTWAMLYGSDEGRWLVFHELQRLGFESLDSEEGQMFYKAERPSAPTSTKAKLTSRTVPPPPVAARAVSKPEKAQVNRSFAEQAKACFAHVPAEMRKLIVVELKAGLSFKKIARKLKLTIWKVSAVNKCVGVRTSTPTGAAARAVRLAKTKELLAQGKSTKEIAKVLNVGVGAVCTMLRLLGDMPTKNTASTSTHTSQGVKFTARGLARKRTIQVLSEDRAEIQADLLTMTTAAVSAKHGVSKPTLCRHFDTKAAVRIRKRARKPSRSTFPEAIMRAVAQPSMRNLPSRQVAEKLGCSKSTVGRIRHQLRAGDNAQKPSAPLPSKRRVAKILKKYRSKIQADLTRMSVSSVGKKYNLADGTLDRHFDVSAAKRVRTAAQSAAVTRLIDVKHLTQQQVAAKLHLSHNTVSRVYRAGKN